MKTARFEEMVAALADQSPAQLRAQWLNLKGTPVPRVSPALLRLALAWEIQAKSLGGLSRKTSQTLQQVANGKSETRAASPGMRLVREWNGTVHVVTVNETGTISWNGRQWNSLSEVVRPGLLRPQAEACGMTVVRCAIYTRKSSEEGLEQDFNSLDAQREACAAYVLSQASEGWKQVGETYDDGGLSGGTLQRPALQRLLDDVKLGKVDIIVVYKVDRLTRSLLDFAKLVEAFDAAGVSFVSVTQSFNTTTSMGRLTLNMLLSFAQFEREVTGERIRDKIAASKAKGMWMGGVRRLAMTHPCRAAAC